MGLGVCISSLPCWAFATLAVAGFPLSLLRAWSETQNPTNPNSSKILPHSVLPGTLTGLGLGGDAAGAACAALAPRSADGSWKCSWVLGYRLQGFDVSFQLLARRGIGVQAFGEVGSTNAYPSSRKQNPRGFNFTFHRTGPNRPPSSQVVG